MTTINNGGPAFPVHPEVREQEPHAGMSLRDHFAGLAMQGMFASDTECWNEEGNWESRASAAYAMADAMLTQREKGAAA